MDTPTAHVRHVRVKGIEDGRQLLNPYYNDVFQRCKEWMKNEPAIFSLSYENSLDIISNSTVFIMYYFPLSTNIDRLVNCTKFTALSYIVDDLSEHDLLHKFLASIEEKGTCDHIEPYLDPRNLLVKALDEVYWEIHDHSSDIGKAYWRLSNSNFGKGVLWENESRKNFPTNFEAFLKKRKLTIGIPILVAMIDYLMECDSVPGRSVYKFPQKDQDYKKLEEFVHMHALMVNELYSYNREWQLGDKINSINMIMKENNYSLQESCNVVRKMIDYYEEQFLETTNEMFKRRKDVEFTAFQMLLSCMYIGNAIYSTNVVRYMNVPEKCIFFY